MIEDKHDSWEMTNDDLSSQVTLAASKVNMVM